MNLSTKGRYAVMAMIELAEGGPGAVVPLSTISEKQDISIPYLEQIFHKLRQKNLVLSVRGAAGGYSLARPASDISAAEIMCAAGESFSTTRCAQGAQGCMNRGATRCKTHGLWAGLGKAIHTYLGAVSLESLSAQQSLQDKNRLESNHTCL